MVLYTMRSLHLQILFETEHALLGQVLNYYVPFAVSLICTILVIALATLTFFFRYVTQAITELS